MRTTIVYGPAYLDRVLRIDGQLVPGKRFDGSVDGELSDEQGVSGIEDRTGRAIEFTGIDPASRPLGWVRIDGILGDFDLMQARSVRVISDTDDLGGMGAGYASALGGTLVSALGPVGDPVGDRISAMLATHGIEHRPIRVAGTVSDWSLIVSSGAHGDKLAIGFRGCHSAVSKLPIDPEGPVYDLLVVASLPNRLIAQALTQRARIRFLAPAMRNARDSNPTLASLAGRFDVMSLNRAEWDATADRETIRDRTPIVVVTDGPDGCTVSYKDEAGTPETITIPAFPRSSTPRDTNRAGEAFAATFVTTLLNRGWTPGPIRSELVTKAAIRGSIAASLVLDMEDFGFPTEAEIQAVEKTKTA